VGANKIRADIGVDLKIYATPANKVFKNLNFEWRKRRKIGTISSLLFFGHNLTRFKFKNSVTNTALSLLIVLFSETWHNIHNFSNFKDIYKISSYTV
jgi:hypothetical protein